MWFMAEDVNDVVSLVATSVASYLPWPYRSLPLSLLPVRSRTIVLNLRRKVLDLRTVVLDLRTEEALEPGI